MRLRHRVHEVLRVGGSSLASRWVNGSILALIVLNVLAIILETVPALSAGYGAAFDAFEVLSVAVFSLEYLARLWAIPEDPAFQGAVRGRLRWMLSPLAIVDLLAVVPFYLPLVVALDLRFLRVLRLFRILRVLKLGRYSRAMQTMGRVFRSKREQLVMTLFTVGVLLLLASSLMYLAEHEAQPEAFGSIPEALWWAVVTLTTVGYGDVVPITPLGRMLGAVIAILGIGMIALPAGILGSGFVDELAREHAEDLEAGQREVCPHCGGELYPRRASSSPSTSSSPMPCLRPSTSRW